MYISVVPKIASDFNLHSTIMSKYFFVLVLSLCFSLSSSGQSVRDLDQSVPIWLEYDENNNAILRWIPDNNASSYELNALDIESNTLSFLDNIDGDISEYDLGQIDSQKSLSFQMEKDQNGRGIITIGFNLPIVHERGRCLIAIDDILTQPLQSEIERLMNDLDMDGWQVDTMSISRSLTSIEVKELFRNWYEDDFDLSQAIFLLGHVPIPYSGNTAYDGHTNHQGAWVADTYYGDVDGLWTDEFVDNITPSRAANDNIPGDGKFDQSRLPSPIEIEIGRVDMFDLPAFSEDEIELTRRYLDKDHDFRMGNKDFPRRAFVDNNFNLAEGFGQTGWKNFTTLFGGDSVSVENYDVLIDNKYLCSYGAGAGSYTSAGGIGNTQNVHANRHNQTVFTFLFGSFFGDWDIRDNFLRAALAWRCFNKCLGWKTFLAYFPNGIRSTYRLLYSINPKCT